MAESRFSSPRANARSGDARSGDPRGAKRASILNAAQRVFVAKGFHQTHISDIARTAGVADGTIYLYFASKDELLVSLLDDNAARFFELLQAELSVLPTAAEKLRRIITLQLGLLDGERALAELVTLHFRQTNRALQAHFATRFNAYLDRIAKVVAEGQRAGEFRTDVSAMVVARAIFGALDGVTLTWALGRADDGGLMKAAEAVSKVLLGGLAAR